MGHSEHALQGMAGDAELFTVVCKEIVEGFWAGRDTVFGILFDLADGPIPDASQLEQPGIELLFLCGTKTKLELPLDHLRLVSGSRCTV